MSFTPRIMVQHRAYVLLIPDVTYTITRENEKVKTIYKLRGNRDREELPHCAV